jgi:NAD(P)-dependent dehydrogenase (short-subunit alcohol dehydrogenase family)
MEKTLDGKVALITGAGSGIGKGAAVRLAQAGAKIGALGRSDDELVQVVKQITRDGGEAIPLVADISKAQEMQDAIDTLVREWGKIDIVFANAGINGVWAPIDELALEEWEKTLSINLTGTFLTIKLAAPYLKEDGGSVIITSSVNGTRKFSSPGATAYSVTKAGQVAMAKMLALELAKHRVRVNVICPGAITTKIEESTEIRNEEESGEPVEYPEGSIPLTDGKAGSPEEVAELVLFLASDASSHITGTEIWIDGGGTLM